jgi:hypothetical protein
MWARGMGGVKNPWWVGFWGYRSGVFGESIRAYVGTWDWAGQAP